MHITDIADFRYTITNVHIANLQITFQSCYLPSIECLACQMSPIKPRAKKACTTCNRRRIRCNVMEQQPCTNCIGLGEKCEIGVSKRGK